VCIKIGGFATVNVGDWQSWGMVFGNDMGMSMERITR